MKRDRDLYQGEVLAIIWLRGHSQAADSLPRWLHHTQVLERVCLKMAAELYWQTWTEGKLAMLELADHEGNRWTSDPALWDRFYVESRSA